MNEYIEKNRIDIIAHIYLLKHSKEYAELGDYYFAINAVCWGPHYRKKCGILYVILYFPVLQQWEINTQKNFFYKFSKVEFLWTQSDIKCATI